jgi:hypothetical protein
MNTHKRVTLLLKPELYDLIIKLTQSTGLPRTSIIHGILLDGLLSLKLISLKKTKVNMFKSNFDVLTKLKDKKHESI